MILDYNNLLSTIDIKKLSTNTIIAYGVSWLYFFISLPLITKIFGVAKGATINYLISWGIMLVMIDLLHTGPVIKIV